MTDTTHPRIVRMALLTSDEERLLGKVYAVARLAYPGGDDDARYRLLRKVADSPGPIGVDDLLPLWDALVEVDEAVAERTDPDLFTGWGVESPVADDLAAIFTRYRHDTTAALDKIKALLAHFSVEGDSVQAVTEKWCS